VRGNPDPIPLAEVSARIVKGFTVTPELIDFGDVLRGETPALEVTVEAQELGPFRIRSAVPTERLERTFSNPASTAQSAKSIEDFELVDQEGKPFRFSQLRGRSALVFFGFTHCPDVCPSTLAKFRLLTDSAGDKIGNAACVMISVDGDRDSPGVLKDYLMQLSPRCIGLTGDPRAVRQIAAQFSAVFFKGLPDKPGGPYLVQHTSQIYLIDRRGRLRASFVDASVDTLRQAVSAIADEVPE
jgi:protein SCO1/2